jgi:RNase P subunit RPR2
VKILSFLCINELYRGAAMDEKNHLGELLTLKERAAEDLYFAQRDRELIAQLAQAQEEEQEELIRKLARLWCPKCGVRLRQRPFHGVMIDECPRCQGSWLDKGELETASLGRGEGWVRSFLEGQIHLITHPTGAHG